MNQMLFKQILPEKKYWNVKDMKQGDNKLRFVGPIIGGWIDWDINRKPHRFKPDNKPKRAFLPEGEIKPFIAGYVWDYSREALYITEFTQRSILASLQSLLDDENWGDFTKYDLKIKKEGQLKQTKYQVIALPPAELNDKIKKSIEESPIRLEALYEGRDPWTDFEPLPENFIISNDLSEAQCAQLDAFLGSDAEAIGMIKKRFNVESVYEIPVDRFDVVMNWLVKRKEDRDGQIGVA